MEYKPKETKDLDATNLSGAASKFSENQPITIICPFHTRRIYECKWINTNTHNGIQFLSSAFVFSRNLLTILKINKDNA